MTIETEERNNPPAPNDEELRTALTSGVHPKFIEAVLEPYQTVDFRSRFVAPVAPDDVGRYHDLALEPQNRHYLRQQADTLFQLDQIEHGERRVICQPIAEQFHEGEKPRVVIPVGEGRDAVARVRAESTLNGAAGMLQVDPAVLEAAKQKSEIKLYCDDENGAPAVIEATIDLGKGFTATIRYFTPGDDRAYIYDSSVDIRRAA